MMGDVDIDIYADLSPPTGKIQGAKLSNGGADSSVKMPPPPSPQDESSNMSTFDLYSDLIDEEHRPKETVEKLQEEQVANQDKIGELTSKIEGLQKENESLQQQNSILKKNISALLKTAKLEVKRKDWKLTQLRLSSRNEYERESRKIPEPKPAPEVFVRSRGNHGMDSDRINPNLIPLGKQRTIGSTSTTSSSHRDSRKQQEHHGESNRRMSPVRLSAKKGEQEHLKQRSQSPPYRRRPCGPHTPPGEPVEDSNLTDDITEKPKSQNREHSPSIRKSKSRERSHSPGQSSPRKTDRPKSHERSNHERHAQDCRQSNVRSFEQGKSSGRKHERSGFDHDSRAERKRKRSVEDDNKFTLVRGDSRVSEKKRDDNRHRVETRKISESTRPHKIEKTRRSYEKTRDTRDRQQNSPRKKNDRRKSGEHDKENEERLRKRHNSEVARKSVKRAKEELHKAKYSPPKGGSSSGGSCSDKYDWMRSRRSLRSRSRSVSRKLSPVKSVHRHREKPGDHSDRLKSKSTSRSERDTVKPSKRSYDEPSRKGSEAERNAVCENLIKEKERTKKKLAKADLEEGELSSDEESNVCNLISKQKVMRTEQRGKYNPDINKDKATSKVSQEVGSSIKDKSNNNKESPVINVDVSSANCSNTDSKLNADNEDEMHEQLIYETLENVDDNLSVLDTHNEIGGSVSMEIAKDAIDVTQVCNDQTLASEMSESNQHMAKAVEDESSNGILKSTEIVKDANDATQVCPDQRIVAAESESNQHMAKTVEDESSYGILKSTEIVDANDVTQVCPDQRIATAESESKQDLAKSVEDESSNGMLTSTEILREGNDTTQVCHGQTIAAAESESKQQLAKFVEDESSNGILKCKTLTESEHISADQEQQTFDTVERIKSQEGLSNIDKTESGKILGLQDGAKVISHESKANVLEQHKGIKTDTIKQPAVTETEIEIFVSPEEEVQLISENMVSPRSGCTVEYIDSCIESAKEKKRKLSGEKTLAKEEAVPVAKEDSLPIKMVESTMSGQKKRKRTSTNIAEECNDILIKKSKKETSPANLNSEIFAPENQDNSKSIVPFEISGRTHSVSDILDNSQDNVEQDLTVPNLAKDTQKKDSILEASSPLQPLTKDHQNLPIVAGDKTEETVSENDAPSPSNPVVMKIHQNLLASSGDKIEETVSEKGASTPSNPVVMKIHQNLPAASGDKIKETGNENSAPSTTNIPAITVIKVGVTLCDDSIPDDFSMQERGTDSDKKMEGKMSPLKVPEKDDSRSISPPLTYEFSSHFIETIDTPMMERSSTNLNISGSDGHVSHHSESLDSSGSSGNMTGELGKVSDDIEKLIQDNGLHKDVNQTMSNKENSQGKAVSANPHGNHETNRGNGHSVSQEEIARLEAVAEKALDIIFGSRFPQRIQKLKKRKVKKSRKTPSTSQGNTADISDKIMKPRVSEGKKQQPSKDPVVIDDTLSERIVNLANTKADVTLPSGLKNEIHEVKLKEGDVTGIVDCKTSEVTEFENQGLHLTSSMGSSIVNVIPGSDNTTDKHTLETKACQGTQSKTVSSSANDDKVVFKEPVAKAEVVTSKPQSVEPDVSDHDDDFVELHPSDTSLIDDVFQESLDETPVPDVSTSPSLDTERSKDEKSRMTSTPKERTSESRSGKDSSCKKDVFSESGESSKFRSERSAESSSHRTCLSRSERSRSNENRIPREAKERERQREHASSRAHSPDKVKERSRGNYLSGDKERRRNSHSYEDRDRGRSRKETGVNHSNHDRCKDSHQTGRKEEKSRSSRYDSQSCEKRPDRERLTRDRLSNERTRTSSSDDIKSILRSVSLKIASEIKEVKSRQKVREAVDSKPRLKVKRSKLGPFGLNISQEENDMQKEAQSNTDIASTSEENKGSSTCIVQRTHDESLSEGEIVSDAESDEELGKSSNDTRSLRSRASDRNRSSQNYVPSRNRGRRDPLCQSPRFISRVDGDRDRRRRDEDQERSKPGWMARSTGRKRRP